MRYITKKKRRYVVDIQRKGNRIKESFPTEVEAQEFRDRILVQYGDVTQTEPLPQEALEPSEHEETQAETTSMSPLNPPPLQSESPPAEILELIKQALGGEPHRVAGNDSDFTSKGPRYHRVPTPTGGTDNNIIRVAHSPRNVVQLPGNDPNFTFNGPRYHRVPTPSTRGSDKNISRVAHNPPQRR